MDFIIGEELEKNLIQKCMQNDAVALGKLIQGYRPRLFDIKKNKNEIINRRLNKLIGKGKYLDW